jgi:peptidoglycan-N-acetylglucosamine deacetylase
VTFDPTAVVAVVASVAAAGGVVLADEAHVKDAGMRIGVSSVQYDNPGAVVPAIVTVEKVPNDFTVTFTATATGAEVTCEGPTWRNPVRNTVSQTCYLRLPVTTGSYKLDVTAQVSKGNVSRTVTGSAKRGVKAEGEKSPVPMSMEDVHRVERCQNDTQNVWLTFDDGGSRDQVTSILATLKRNDVQGHFFFLGDWARENPGLLKKIKDDGHVVGNHTSTHPALSQESSAAVRDQIRSGVKASILRPPYGAGAYTTRLRDLAAEQGYTVCRWTADTYDWEGPTTERMVERITYGDSVSPPVEAGGNILMHGHGKHTAPGLQKLIDAIRGKGLTLQRLPAR